MPGGKRGFQQAALSQGEEDVAHHQGEVASGTAAVGETGQPRFDHPVQGRLAAPGLAPVDDVVMDQDESVQELQAGPDGKKIALADGRKPGVTTVQPENLVGQQEQQGANPLAGSADKFRQVVVKRGKHRLAQVLGALLGEVAAHAQVNPGAQACQSRRVRQKPPSGSRTGNRWERLGKR